MRVYVIGLTTLALAGQTFAQAPKPTFETTVQPVITKSCVMCHNDRMTSGGLNVAAVNSESALHGNREQWERIIHKIRTGEMPPKGIPKPPAEQTAALMKFVQEKWEEADRKIPADPGRVTARRLNRVEYSNTVRDLLGVDYKAQRDFPSDDSGYGFDNIGDVLTISPVLMEKYLDAAEQIASRAIGADPLPKKPLSVEYSGKTQAPRKVDRSTVELTHRVDWDAEYTLQVGLPGERPADAKPVMLAIFMDGKKIAEKMVETKPSKLVYFNPYSEEEFKLFLPEGDHAFRFAFLNDEYVKQFQTDKESYNQKKNKYIGSVIFNGPFAPAVPVEKASRKKILICDLKTSGDTCAYKIVSTLAHRAYRRPVTKAEVDGLFKFVTLAKTEKQSLEQGLQLAIQAMLVSPHFLFRIERDPVAGMPHPVTELELASRLSYFLWSSMPDEPLQALAEKGQLRANLETQVKRMLEDPKSAAFADNFAGQWLETRNLDSVKPDPKMFPQWGPELREDMRTETRLFFDAMLRENRPMSEFLDAKFTFLNDRLAKHYGIEGVEGSEFRRVELTTSQRGGLLSQASVLTVSSYPTRTSPVIRGKYVLQNILGAPPPPPPPDVPSLDEAAVGSAGSLRQQLEKHRSNAMCASCHSRMDVLGFGLENYDAIGRWRTKDGKFEIDSSGTLPNGKSFKGPDEMRKLLLADVPEFSRCLTEKMLTYSLGRGLERFDRRTLEDLNKKLAAADYRFQTLLFEIVKSLPFQQRRGEMIKSETKPKEIAQR